MSNNKLTVHDWDGRLILENKTLYHGDHGEVLTLAALLANPDCVSDADVTQMLLRATSFTITGPTTPKHIGGGRIDGAQVFNLVFAMAVRRVGYMPVPCEKRDNCGESVTVMPALDTPLGIAEAAIFIGGKPTAIYGSAHDTMMLIPCLCPWLKELARVMGAERLTCRTTDTVDESGWIKMDVKLCGAMTVHADEKPADLFDQLGRNIARLHEAYLDACHPSRNHA